MKALLDEVTARGGIVSKSELVALGASDRDLTHAVRSGALSRPRRGYYSTLPADSPLTIAVAVGGRLTGMSALRQLGAWMWSEPPIEIAVLPNASRLRSRAGVRIYWNDRRNDSAPGNTSMVGVRQALIHAIPRVRFDEAVALLDWALSSRRLDRAGFAAVIAHLPRRCARIEGYVDSKAESFLESIIRTRLRILGRTVTSQVPVGRRQRIDLVVDDVVAIEFDGRAWHADSFEADRSKDLVIISEGRIVLRLSYTMVRQRWHSVVAAIDSAAAVHRGGPKARSRRRRSVRPTTLGSVPWALPRRTRHERSGRRSTVAASCPA